jgi:CBS domain-containing protein
MSDKKIIRVREVMKAEFDVVDGMSTVKDALASMKHTDPKCLVVKKRHDDDEYGLLLVSDIGRRVLAQNRAPDRVNVYEIMAKPVVTVRPDMDIRYCARLFDEFNLSRAPVVENGEVVGIVSFTDLVLRGMQEE